MGRLEVQNSGESSDLSHHTFKIREKDYLIAHNEDYEIQLLKR